jgi:precorrin-6B methylase 2
MFLLILFSIVKIACICVNWRQWGPRCRDRLVIGFITTYAISFYHHWCTEFESRSRWCVQHYVKVCQRLATGRWFSPGSPVSSTNKTDRHDITEILLKVALNTTTIPAFITKRSIRYLSITDIESRLLKLMSLVE